MREKFLRRSIIVMVIGALLIFVSSPRAFAAETINLDDIQSFMSIDSGTSQSTTTTTTDQPSGSGSTGASTNTGTSTSTETGTTSSSTGSSSTSGTTSSSTSGTNPVSSKSKDDNLPETGSNTEVIFTIGSIILVSIAICAHKRANIKM